jgi:glycosyltransferase involved in cell wall biosynthesis
MIYFDVTKTGSAGHRSGLTRVSTRLREELGKAAVEFRWPRSQRLPRPDDWFVSAELFSEPERPGFTAFLDARRCHLAAIFHDAIPLKFPHITWPQSVARHPGYMKLLARFDRVWAVSRSARDELTGFWRWQGVTRPPPVDLLALGADFNGQPRAAAASAKVSRGSHSLICLGILEPRKNQAFLLDVCEELWREQLVFDLHVVGRVNPHYGGPTLRRIKALAKQFPGLHFHHAAGDARVAKLYATARATVVPTLAEGCGLPLLESLWMGVPCVCSDLPVLRENAGAGCLTATVNDRESWKAALRRILTDDTLHARLSAGAASQPLPTWRDTARSLLTLR